MAGKKNKKEQNELVEIPLEIVPEPSVETETAAQPAVEKVVEGDIVQMNQSNAARVYAGKVEFKQGGAGQVDAEQVTVHAGGVGRVEATTVHVEQGGVGFIRAGEVSLDKCQNQVLVAQTVTTRDSMTGVLIASEVHANPLRAVVVLAQKIDGQVETQLDTRGAILAGLTGGIAFGLVSLVGRLLARRNR